MSGFFDFYGSSTTLVEYKYLTTEDHHSSTNDLFVSDSVFRECKSESSGGALYCSSNVKILVEVCTFISCTTTTNYGGAICFSCAKSFLDRVCAFDCSSTYAYSYGQCLYILTGSDTIHNNYINDSSIYNTKNTFSGSYHALRIQNGNILLTKNNITNNYCYYYSSLYCNPSKKSACIAYSSFVNNTSNCQGCMYLISSQQIMNCNIINNEQETKNTQSTIETDGNLFIFDSCILENNKNKVIFRENNPSYRIVLANCTVDGDLFSGSRFIKSLTIESTNKKAFINGLVHLRMNKCKASFDSVGTLTVALNIIINKGICASYVHNPKDKTIDALKVVKYILINTFLTSNPSRIN